MRHRRIRVIAPLAILVAVLSCGGADGLAPTSTAITRPSDSMLTAGLYASGPVAGGYISPDRIDASRSATASAVVSWVSLVPGTVPEGTTATIINLRTAERITVAIVDGGFDPQPIPASLGDTIQVSVDRTSKPQTAAVLSLAARPGPRIVRTRPPRGQTDAPLNTIITLVFSEPLDPVSVNTTSVTLTTGDTPVAGAVRILPGPGYAVEFTPSALLAPSTTYSLTVSGVKNLADAPLDAPTSIAFATGAVGSGSVAPPTSDALELTFQDVSLVTGDTIQMRGYVYRGQGQWSTEALEWTISDPSVASIRLLDTNLVEVRALRSGSVTISARTLGSQQELSARASLQVFARSSQPSPIVVDEFSVLEQIFAVPVFVYAPNLRLRDTSATGSARVIGITIDLPGADRRLYCAANRVLGTESWTVFPPPGDQNGYFLGHQGGFQRLPDIAVDAMAHVTAVLSDGLGVSFTVTGKIVPNFSSWPWNESGIYAPPCEYMAPR